MSTCPPSANAFRRGAIVLLLTIASVPTIGGVAFLELSAAFLAVPGCLCLATGLVTLVWLDDVAAFSRWVRGNLYAARTEETIMAFWGFGYAVLGAGLIVYGIGSVLLGGSR